MRKALFYFLIGMSLLLISCEGLKTKKKGALPRIEITKKWITDDETKDNQKGIVIHLDMIAHNMNAISLKIIAYIEQPKGTPLEDKYHVYSDDDKLCFSTYTVTCGDYDPLDNYEIFIPNDVFDMGDDIGTFYFNIRLYDEDNEKYLDDGNEYLSYDLASDDEFNPPAEVDVDNVDNEDEVTYDDEPQGDKYYIFDTGGLGNMEMWVHPDGSSTIKTTMLCYSCRGSKKCNICGGSGNAYAMIGGYMACPSCLASPGACATCKGNGQIVNTNTWTPAQAQAYLDAHREIKSQYEHQSRKYTSESKREYIDVIEYETNYTGKSNDKWCEKCQKSGPAHYHVKKRIPN